MTVLQEAGARFPNQAALDVFEEAGADVDHDAQIVKIPPDLVIESVARAPRTYTMASRGDERLDLYLDGTKTYCGTDGTGTTTVDLGASEPRPSTKEDVAMMARISDYLSLGRPRKTLSGNREIENPHGRAEFSSALLPGVKPPTLYSYVLAILLFDEFVSSKAPFGILPIVRRLILRTVAH